MADNFFPAINHLYGAYIFAADIKGHILVYDAYKKSEKNEFSKPILKYISNSDFYVNDGWNEQNHVSIRPPLYNYFTN